MGKLFDKIRRVQDKTRPFCSAIVPAAGSPSAGPGRGHTRPCAAAPCICPARFQSWPEGRTISSALRPFLPALQRRHKLPVQLRMLRTQGTEELRL